MTKDNSVEVESAERKEFVQVTVRLDSLEKYRDQGWEQVGESSGYMVTVRKSLRKCACHE